MPDAAVHWSWGDGAEQDGGTTETHEYDAPGSYTIRATGDGIDARASVPVAGPDDAHPMLTIPDVTATSGETVTYETGLADEDGTSEQCYGHVEITPDSGTITAASLSIVQKEFMPGVDVPVELRDQPDGSVIGEYGKPDGFPVAAGLDGHTTNELRYDGDPFTATCRTEIRLLSGAVLCHAEWSLTVEAAS